MKKLLFLPVLIIFAGIVRGQEMKDSGNLILFHGVVLEAGSYTPLPNTQIFLNKAFIAVSDVKGKFVKRLGVSHFYALCATHRDCFQFFGAPYCPVTGAPSLAAGQAYYVRYENSAATSGRLWSCFDRCLAVNGTLRADGRPTEVLSDRVLEGPEDGRYQRLRESWGERFQARMLVFFQGQALLAVLFSLPPLVAMGAVRPRLDLLDAAGALLWLAAVGGEVLADRQLAAHRADPANRGRTCRRGLWRYSRHPNYFFEWLHWWAYALIAWGAPFFWVTVAAPFVMLIFVLFISGIPPTEARALASRGEDYRRYQRSTSAFFPWFPKPEVDPAESGGRES